MIDMIAAVLAAAQPVATPASPQMQHAQMQPGQMAPMTPQQHEAMKKECCCKDMMEKKHSEMHRMQDHREHSGH